MIVDPLSDSLAIGVTLAGESRQRTRTSSHTRRARWRSRPSPDPSGSDFGTEVKSHDHEPPPPFALERLCKRPAIGSRPDAGKHRDGWVYGKHSTQHCRQGHRFSYHFGSYHVPRPLQAHPCGAARQVFPPSPPSWHEQVCALAHVADGSCI